jgi:hypothetical protein
MEKRIFEINPDLLKDYNDIKNLNPNNWDISSYLNLKYDINAAIAFSKLYFPDFIEKENCIILGFRYNEAIFTEWYKHYKGEISEVERTCNRYDINGLF